MASKPGKKTEIKDIKRKSAVDERREIAKAKFLAKLAEMPIIQVAASQSDIHRDTYYDWRNTDSLFREAAEAALAKGNEFVSDMMESLLIKKAKDGNMTAIIFWLKNHTAQYNDKRYIEHQHHFDNPLTEERKAEIGAVLASWDMDDPDFEEYEDPSEHQADKGPQRPVYDEDGNLIR